VTDEQRRHRRQRTLAEIEVWTLLLKTALSELSFWYRVLRSDEGRYDHGREHQTANASDGAIVVRHPEHEPANANGGEEADFSTVASGLETASHDQPGVLSGQTRTICPL
jgi:hypothetical protein